MSLGSIEQRTEGMKRQAQELIEQAYNHGFKAGYDKAFATLNENWQLVTSEAEEKGRNMAWEAASKIIKMGEYSRKFEVFSECSDGEYPFDKVSASEAIERIRAYEEQKKQEEDNEIHVGDEVTDGNGIKGVVVGSFRNADGTEFISILGTGEDFEVPQIMPKEDYKKTGRHFPEIAEVLKKMKEGEE